MSVLDRLAARLISLLVILAIVVVAVATAFGFLVLGAFMLLSVDLPGWVAALITGGGLLLLVAVSALVFLVAARSGNRTGSTDGGRQGGSRQDEMSRSVAALDRALQGDPWTLVAGALGVGVVLGMNPQARDAATRLAMNLLRPPHG